MRKVLFKIDGKRICHRFFRERRLALLATFWIFSMLLLAFSQWTFGQDSMPSTEYEAAIWLVQDGNAITRNEHGQVTKVVLDYVPTPFVVGDLDVFPYLETLHINHTGRFYDHHMTGIARLKNIKSFQVYHCDEITDESLAVLRYLPKLEEVVLENCESIFSLGPLVECGNIKRLVFSENGQFDFNDLHQIGHLPKLESLTLRQNKSLEDQHFKLIAKLKALKRLDVGANKAITDEGISALGGLQLLELNVDECKLIKGETLEDLNAGLESLNLRKCSISDEGVKQLARFTNLRRLVLNENKKISNKELGVVSQLVKLEVLDLSGLPFGDEHLQGFNNCTTLKDVNLSGCNGVSGVGIEELTGSAGLRVLNLAEATRVNSAAIEAIGKFPNLKELRLNGCTRIRSESLAHLSKLERLEFLDISQCKRIDDKAIEWIADLKSLSTLRLLRLSRLTDDSIRSLARLPKLKVLTIAHNLKIRGEGFDSFPDDCPLETLDLESLDNVTPEGVQNLSRFKNLQRLDLNCKNLRDEHVLALMGAPKLTYFDLDSMKNIDPEVYRRFRNSLPSYLR